ncbi:Proline-specific permease proY [Klebsiella pneumoniae IS46]|nr:Proline-specific permease proY [Klebsiella pneumoniae IS46]
MTTVIGLLFLAFIIALIGYHPDTRISLYVGMAWIALLLLGWVFKTAVSAAWRRLSNRHRPGQHRAAGAACGPASSPVILPQKKVLR